MLLGEVFNGFDGHLVLLLLVPVGLGKFVAKGCSLLSSKHAFPDIVRLLPGLHGLKTFRHGLIRRLHNIPECLE